MKFGRERMEKLDLKSERGHTESERWRKGDEKKRRKF